VTGRPSCWCGNSELVPFSPGYFRCARCETLVWGQMPGPEITRVVDEATEFYGREYWFSHQERDLGFPNIFVRARNDLAERALYWLRTVLKYKLPPAQALELGSGPGAFVAMLRWAGFDATGLEISPWVVWFIRETFEVPVLHGPVEEQQIEPASLDLIALMDVFEHFRDPVDTMRRCLDMLKPDGIVLIQTPCYPEGRSYEELAAAGDRFVENLKPTDHLHLFSRRSICDFFRRLGVDYVAFEPGLFEYDMFVVVSRVPPVIFGPAEIDAALSARPAGRMIQALLDLDATGRDLRRRNTESEADRAARLAQVEELTAQLRESEADRAARLAQVEELAAQLRESEADRAARLAQVEEVTRQLRESDADRAARLEQIHELSRLLRESETDRAARFDVIQNLQARIAEIERTWAWRLYSTLPPSLTGRKPAE
jgi:SAM-dependent methyltransferase